MCRKNCSCNKLKAKHFVTCIVDVTPSAQVNSIKNESIRFGDLVDITMTVDAKVPLTKGDTITLGTLEKCNTPMDTAIISQTAIVTLDGTLQFGFVFLNPDGTITFTLLDGSAVTSAIIQVHFIYIVTQPGKKCKCKCNKC